MKAIVLNVLCKVGTDVLIDIVEGLLKILRDRRDNGINQDDVDAIRRHANVKG